MTDEDFVPLGVGPETPFWECAECHALVLDQPGKDGHLGWHLSVAQVSP